MYSEVLYLLFPLLEIVFPLIALVTFPTILVMVYYSFQESWTPRLGEEPLWTGRGFCVCPSRKTYCCTSASALFTSGLYALNCFILSCSLLHPKCINQHVPFGLANNHLMSA